MIDETKARELALASDVGGRGKMGTAQELREGWFFPLKGLIGTGGVIVNKHHGRVFTLGSAFPVERDLRLYDLGYQADAYDLVILAIHDLKATRRALGELGLQRTDPTYEGGRVWRILRSLTDADIWTALERLPCIFAAQNLYHRLEILEEAKAQGWFTFDAVEYRRRASLQE